MGQKGIKIIKYLFSCLLEVLYPNDKCVICGQESESGLCPICRSQIKRIDNTDNEIISYSYYSGVVKKLILQMKYKSDFTAAGILAEFLVQIIKEKDIKADYICFVPMTKKSIKKRGFNQCQLLAEEVSRKTGIALSRSVIKVNDTKEQKTLSKEERAENIKGAFKVLNGEKFKGSKIILIDDVTTTGATMNECKNIIEKCKIDNIFILTIAKSDI